MAARGALEPGFEADYLAYCHRYAAGTVDMVEMHRFTVGAHFELDAHIRLDGGRQKARPAILHRLVQLLSERRIFAWGCK